MWDVATGDGRNDGIVRLYEAWLFWCGVLTPCYHREGKQHRLHTTSTRRHGFTTTICYVVS